MRGQAASWKGPHGKELRHTANIDTSETFWKQIFQPHSSLQITAVLVNFLTATSWETLSQNLQTSYSQIPDPPKLCEIWMFAIKPLFYFCADYVNSCLNYCSCFSNLSFFLFFFSVFLGPHPWHMEVPRLGGGLELQLLAYTTVWAMSAACTAAHSNARSLTHWTGPGMEPTSSWMLVGFVTGEPQQELL